MALTGKILEWNGARGFGYLEHEGRRIFLHIRDFTERPRTPEPGDPVTFVLGSDRQGRPCAQQAVFLGTAGRFRTRHLLILVFLLLPGYAVFYHTGPTGLGYMGAWVALNSIITYLIYAADKRRAREKAQREPEIMLHLLELLGGWPGAFFAQRRLRHKSAKGSYQFVFILIIGLHQFLAIDALRGWPFIHSVFQGLQKL
jgi:uncharacterized membrane protein YsdA (DUF1294 family)/cold shock CspA family protein